MGCTSVTSSTCTPPSEPFVSFLTDSVKLSSARLYCRTVLQVESTPDSAVIESPALEELESVPSSNIFPGPVCGFSSGW
jgi:hypothetical protein